MTNVPKKTKPKIKNSNATFHFIKTSLKSPKTIGAIAPSSQQLAKAMIKGLVLNSTDCLIELGPGTGSLTRQIALHLNHHHNYLGIEREEFFVKHLKNHFKELHFFCGSAEDMVEIHTQQQQHPVKAIISGLPFATLPKQVRINIIKAIDTLMQTGSIFRTFQYVHSYFMPSAIQFRKEMEALFGKPISRRMVLGNLPPAFVFTWQR